MIESIYYYLYSKGQTNQIASKAEIAINHTKNGAQVLLLKDIPDTYMPRCWIEIIKKYFSQCPEKFNECLDDKFAMDSLKRQFEIESKRQRDALNPEQQFIADNIFSRFPKAGISLSELSVNSDFIKFITIGDNFVFLYDRQSKKLSVYCSMISEHGKVNFSQPCHAFYSDSTILGKPLSIEKRLSNFVILIMTRDLANWFMEEFHKNKESSIDRLLDLTDSSFDELVSKCAKRSQYLGLPFNSDGTALIIIPVKQNSKRQTIKELFYSFIKRFKLHLIGGGILITVALIAYSLFRNYFS